ncbi:MAG TPA: OB-fold domain-containing protein [Patescibacteria group bacterium]|jgi:uncharacterized OB-fold protein|nr:OB-fold domain-containing protein [Patescibacteria group bacterium]
MISPVKVWRNQKFVARMVARRGVVVSWTVIRVPPADFGYQAPYPVVIVRLDGGESIAAQMVDYEEKHLAIGQKVISVVRRTIQTETDDVIPYGIKVKPI